MLPSVFVNGEPETDGRTLLRMFRVGSAQRTPVNVLDEGGNGILNFALPVLPSNIRNAEEGGLETVSTIPISSFRFTVQEFVRCPGDRYCQFCLPSAGSSFTIMS